MLRTVAPVGSLLLAELQKDKLACDIPGFDCSSQKPFHISGGHIDPNIDNIDTNVGIGIDQD